MTSYVDDVMQMDAFQRIRPDRAKAVSCIVERLCGLETPLPQLAWGCRHTRSGGIQITVDGYRRTIDMAKWFDQFCGNEVSFELFTVTALTFSLASGHPKISLELSEHRAHFRSRGPDDRNQHDADVMASGVMENPSFSTQLKKHHHSAVKHCIKRVLLLQELPEAEFTASYRTYDCLTIRVAGILNEIDLLQWHHVFLSQNREPAFSDVESIAILSNVGAQLEFTLRFMDLATPTTRSGKLQTKRTFRN
jgi:hypothetical protein